MEQNKYKLKAILNTNYSAVKYRISGKPHYQIYLQLHSNDEANLDNVSFVEYKLHPTFKDRIKVSANRLNNFQIEIIAWGTFEVEVTVGLKDSSPFFFKQDLKDVLERVPM